MLATPFFLIVFAIFETTAFFIAEMNLDQAVVKASRYVQTGEIANAGLDETVLRQRVCDEILFMLDCNLISIDLHGYSKFSDIPTSTPVRDGQLDKSNFSVETVNPGEIMELRAFYEWPLYTDLFGKILSNLNGGKRLITSTAVFKTEPFSGV